jgi:hypothetical protein
MRALRRTTAHDPKATFSRSLSLTRCVPDRHERPLHCQQHRADRADAGDLGSRRLHSSARCHAISCHRPGRFALAIAAAAPAGLPGWIRPKLTPARRGNTHAGRTVPSHIGLRLLRPAPDATRRNGMAPRIPPRKVTYFEPVPPRLARNTIIESTFDVGRRLRCTIEGGLPGSLPGQLVLRRMM